VSFLKLATCASLKIALTKGILYSAWDALKPQVLNAEPQWNDKFSAYAHAILIGLNLNVA